MLSLQPPRHIPTLPDPKEPSLSKYLAGYPQKPTSLDTIGMSQIGMS